VRASVLEITSDISSRTESALTANIQVVRHVVSGQLQALIPRGIHSTGPAKSGSRARVISLAES
jgi:hypothetical protein